MTVRVLWSVQLHPTPSYTIVFPHAQHPTQSVRATVPIKATVATLDAAKSAALRELLALTPAEIELLYATAQKDMDPLHRDAN